MEKQLDEIIDAWEEWQYAYRRLASSHPDHRRRAAALAGISAAGAVPLPKIAVAFKGLHA